MAKFTMADVRKNATNISQAVHVETEDGTVKTTMKSLVKATAESVCDAAAKYEKDAVRIAIPGEGKKGDPLSTKAARLDLTRDQFAAFIRTYAPGKKGVS